jgi:hypothetical protein
MHLTLSDELHQYNFDDYEKEAFAPIQEEAALLGQEMSIMFKPSHDIDADITQAANEGRYDLLLVGVGQSIFEGSLLGKLLGFTTRIINPDLIVNKVTGKEKLFENSPFDERMRFILARTQVPVGILIDKQLKAIQEVFVPVLHPNDRQLFFYAEKIGKNTGSMITVFDPIGLVKNKRDIKEALRQLEKECPGQVELMEGTAPDLDLLRSQHLMLISLESWKHLLEQQSAWLNAAPSTLILRR